MSELAKKLDELSEIHAGENPLTSWLDDAAERVRGLEAVEQAMAEDLVKLAERCDKLEAENARLREVLERIARHHFFDEYEAEEIARKALDEKKSFAADSRAPGC